MYHMASDTDGWDEECTGTHTVLSTFTYGWKYWKLKLNSTIWWDYTYLQRYWSNDHLIAHVAPVLKKQKIGINIF